MDPTLVSRIDELKASIPKGTLEGLEANASTLSPAAILAMVDEERREVRIEYTPT
jgi:hypothetical protein